MANKVFKAKVAFLKTLQLSEGLPLGTDLHLDYMFLAQTKERCIFKLSILIRRSIKRMTNDTNPIRTLRTIVMKITVYELDSQTTATNPGLPFFEWEAGGPLLPEYDVYGIRSVYRDHKDEAENFSNLKK